MTPQRAFRLLDRAVFHLDARPDVDIEAREWAIRILLEASCEVATGKRPVNPRQRGDDDGVEYADPREVL